MSSSQSFKPLSYVERPNGQALPPFTFIYLHIPENGDLVQNFLDALKNKVRELTQESRETTDRSLRAGNFVLIQKCAQEYERFSNKEVRKEQASPQRVHKRPWPEFHLLRSGRVSTSPRENRPGTFKGQLAPRDLYLLRIEWRRMRRRVEFWLFLKIGRASCRVRL